MVIHYVVGTFIQTVEVVVHISCNVIGHVIIIIIPSSAIHCKHLERMMAGFLENMACFKVYLHIW